MITRTFHDIYDLVALAECLKHANISIEINDGDLFFDVTNYELDANGMITERDRIKIDGSSIQVRGFCENIDKAYRILEEKIASGDWKKADDCA
jgi:hypothetical protein